MARPDIADLPFHPDLAILCTNASRNLALLDALGAKFKRALSLSAPRHMRKNCLPVPGIIKCVCWVTQKQS